MVHTAKRRMLLLALLALVGPLVLAGGSTAAPRAGDLPGPAARLGETTYPLLDFRGAADPTIVRFGDQYVALSTGPSAPRAVAPTLNGPWTDAGNALLTLPPWALDNRIWASDLVQTQVGWVLYFSAPVAGVGRDARCIGAATAASPLDSFTPQPQPLVCPRRADAPAAYDIARPARGGLPRRVGVIDPEGFTDRDGTRYVLYRTQSRPSSLRIVKVPSGGRAAPRRQDSVELLRRRGVVENPVLTRRGKYWVLFTSEGYFGDCGYVTAWRKARTLEGLAKAPARDLLTTARTGLCGPGGADLLGQSVLVFHSWTCSELRTHCPPGIDYDKTPTYGSRRAMFGAVLAWTKNGVPSVSSYVAPTVNPWADPVVPAPVP